MSESVEEKLDEMPLTVHIIALRKYLIRIVAVLFSFFLLLLPFARYIYETMSAPLRGQLPTGAHMIATDVTATFMAPFKLNLFVALFLAMPFILYQIWQYVRPALFQSEKHLAKPILALSIILFYTGIAFAYFVVLPSVLGFFMHISPESVTPMTDINSYLSFCLKLFLVFGLCFEIPVATLLLILTGAVSVSSLAAKRRFIIVACFFVAMFVTPPDALSMLMLAVPMWLLFELGLLVAKLMIKRRQQSNLAQS